MQICHRAIPKAQIIPISANKRKQIDVLESSIQTHLPPSEFYYPADQTRQITINCHYSELIREKLLWSLEAEVPHWFNG